MKNTLVLAICVSKYTGDNLTDLKGISTDMESLKRIWCESFNFEMIVNNPNDNNDNNHNNNNNNNNNKN